MDKQTLYEAISILKRIYKIKVRKENPFEVLVHGILSARTKDEVTYAAQEKLLKIANTPQKLAKLPLHKIQKLIYPVNYYRGKAKKLKKVSQVLLQKFGGKVPKKREELLELPGVGSKIADLILLFGYGQNVIPVDTHVEAISKRWHLVDWNAKPTAVREKLHQLIAEKDRAVVNQLLVAFGKEICTRPIPKCYMCPVEKLCPYEKKNLYKQDLYALKTKAK
jgi:endonuclease-3